MIYCRCHVSMILDLSCFAACFHTFEMLHAQSVYPCLLLNFNVTVTE